MSSIAFIINGEGLGNAVRCDAVIEELDPSIPIVLFCSNNSYKYFNRKQSHYKLVKLHPYSYQKNRKGDISFFWTLLFFWSYIGTYLKNIFLLRRELIRNGVSCIVSDSDYSFIVLRILYRARYFSINNAHYVMSKWKENKRHIIYCFPQFLIELSDAIVQYLFADLIFCPTFNNKVERKRKLLFVPPIVRKSFYEFDKKSRDGELVVGILPSGSSLHLDFIASEILFTQSYKKLVPENLNSKMQNLKCFAKFENSIAVYRESDVLITNAGMSCLSEIAVTGLPAVISPIASHFEQAVNASVLSDSNHIVVSNKVGIDDIKRLLAIDGHHATIWIRSAKYIARVINRFDQL